MKRRGWTLVLACSLLTTAAMSQIPAPNPPVANAATNIGPFSFTANWDTSATATTYYLQVATDTIFRLPVTGYNNINVGNVKTYAVAGLNPSTKYFYRVRAGNAGGTSNTSNIIVLTTLVPVPQALPATNVTQTSFTANWDTAVSAAAYLLDAATDTNFTAFVPGVNGLNVGNVLSWNLSGLTGGTKYFYRVRATNATGTSGNSNIIAQSTIPATPVATAATNIVQSSFSANWKASAGVTAYVLQVATDSVFKGIVSGFNNISVGNVLTYPVTGLSPSTRYYYHVRAGNAAGTSPASNIIGVTTLIPIPPVPVALAATNISQTSFTAHWDTAATAAAYFLDVATDTNFTAMVTPFNNLNVGNVVAWNVSGLAGGTKYFYRVRASNAGGTTASSNIIALTTVVATPLPPVAAPAGSITQTSFTATWGASTGATAYFLDVASDSTFTALLAGFNNLNVGNVLTRSVTGLTAGTKYFYRVRAGNVGGTSGNSNVIAVTTVVPAPAPPVAVAATNVTQTSFAAAWNSSAGATAYQVDVATDTNFTAFLPGYSNLGVGGALSLAVAGASPGTKYFYRVRGSNAGGTSGNSNVISVTTVVATPPPPAALAASNIAPTSFTANWSAAAGATTYYLDVASDTLFTVILASYGNLNVGNVLTRSVTGLTPATKYFYRVRAGNVGGTSANSSIVALTTQGVPPPAPVLSSPANGSAGQPGTLTLSWGAASGAAAYIVQVSLDPSFAFPFVDDTAVAGVTRTLAGLALNTTYYWRVGGKNQYGRGAYSSPVYSFSTVRTTALSGTVAFPPAPAQADYRMVSVPGMTPGKVADLVGGSGGNQGFDWRVFRIPANGVAAEMGPSELIAPGEGVWLIRKNPLALSKSDTLPSLQPGGIYPIPLHQGWNIIGDPFEVPVRWSDVRSYNGLLFSDVIQGWSGSYAVDTVLAPFRAYYFYNANTEATTLNIPYPLPSTLQRVPSPAPVIDWTVSVAFVTAENTDADCVLGVSPSGGSDSLAIRKPPLAFAGGEVYFTRGQKDGTTVKFSTDFRLGVAAVEQWDIRLARPAGCTGTLRFSGVEAVPPRYRVILVGPEDGLPVDLRTQSAYPLRSPAGTVTATVLVGDAAAVASRLAALVPQAYVLDQNYPNPFNPSTTIRYGLTQKGVVQLTVFNALGQEVRQLVNGEQEAGYHEIRFDGTGLASGVYFYRIHAGTFVQTKRFVLLK